MDTLIKDIYPFFKEVFTSLGLEEDIWSHLIGPATIEGDYDIALPCHSLSRLMKKSPVDISEQIVTLFSNDVFSIAKVSSKNGFVNIGASPSWLEEQLSCILSDERLGVATDNSRIFAVDYSAAN